MLKILLVGLGSIGRRHLSCLKTFDGVEVGALRTHKGTRTDSSGLDEFATFEEALGFNPDGVIICNPTSMHVKTAIPFLEHGFKVLIEKPLSHNSAEAKRILPYSHLVKIAYCMRFHPINSLVKDILSREQLLKLGFRRSYYLPKWHPYADYRTEYAARKELGGGVIRTLSHEIDLMINWLGIPDSVCGVTDKVSHLDISTDDYAFFCCGYRSGGRVNFDLDFLSPVNINTGELYTNRGKYSWDMEGMNFIPYKEAEISESVAFNTEVMDQMYNRQAEDFIEFVNGGGSRNASPAECIELQRIIERVEE